MPQSQRQPVPYSREGSRKIEIVQDAPSTGRVIDIGTQVHALQRMSTIPIGTALRRMLFVWFRIYVHETKYGKHEKVNVKIPLPIPLLGATFARQMSFQKAAQVAAQLQRGQDPSDALESAMGFEFIRVEDDHSERNKRSLVVIGLD